MKHLIFIISILLIFIGRVQGQESEVAGMRIHLRGMVMDATTYSAVQGSQIYINKDFSAVSAGDGTFSLYVNKNDTVSFKSLGYKPDSLFISDTLSGREFITGIFLSNDTISIGEVIILPRFTNLKSEILNSRSITSTEMENARYNVAVSAYQGRTTINSLGDPANNYELLRQKQKVDAYEKGGIPSDKMIGLSPFLLVPAAYLLIHGPPEKPTPYKPQLTDQEVDEIHKKYLETRNMRK